MARRLLSRDKHWLESPLDSSLKIVKCKLYHLVFHQKLDFEIGDLKANNFR